MHKTHFLRRPRFLWAVGIIITLIASIAIWFRISPIPGAFVISTVFDAEAQSKREAMQSHTPATPVSVTSDIPYADAKETTLDIYTPQSATQDDQALPAVIWTHGGAWLSGDKVDSDAYFKKLANQGFIVIAPNYTLAPKATYPSQITQLNQALHYINTNADALSINRQKIVLAGDSAGAQLSSQMAAIITNPTYAKTVGIAPAMTPSQINALLLFCGIYQLETLTNVSPNLPKIVGWGMDITVWSLFGSRDINNPHIKQASTFYHANKAFPPSFISGGNGDGLTTTQSKPFAAKLQSLGVDTTTLFYNDNHTPSLPHENQFIFDKDGLENFDATVAFLKSKTNL